MKSVNHQIYQAGYSSWLGSVAWWLIHLALEQITDSSFWSCSVISLQHKDSWFIRERKCVEGRELGSAFHKHVLDTINHFYLLLLWHLDYGTLYHLILIFTKCWLFSLQEQAVKDFFEKIQVSECFLQNTRFCEMADVPYYSLYSQCSERGLP